MGGRDGALSRKVNGPVLQLLSILFLGIASLGAHASELAPSRVVNAQPELAGYESCIEGLVASVEKKRFLFRAPLLWFDPKLYQMVDGVRVLLLNYKWLSAQYAERPIEVADAHLISNAAQGCAEYQRGFEARVSLFARFFGGIAATLLTLTLAILLNMVAAARNGLRRQAKADQPVTVKVGANVGIAKGPQDVSTNASVPPSSRQNKS